MHIKAILPPAYLMLHLFISGVGDGWRTEDSVSGSGVGAVWAMRGRETSEVLLIAVVNVTFTAAM